jgi:hypothetical protein
LSLRGGAIDVDDDEDDPDQINNEENADEQDELGEDFQALDKSNNIRTNNRMETDPSIPDA